MTRAIQQGNRNIATWLGKRLKHVVAWPSGLRRWFKAPVSSEAWVRIPPLPIFFLYIYYIFSSSNLHVSRIQRNSGVNSFHEKMLEFAYVAACALINSVVSKEHFTCLFLPRQSKRLNSLP